jgi:hypothetical protein
MTGEAPIEKAEKPVEAWYNREILEIVYVNT